jgi:hypothetical protein
MSKKCNRISVAVTAVFLCVALVSALAWVRHDSVAGIGPTRAARLNLSASEDEFENLVTYKWGSMSFKYPSGWRIEPQLYRTPPEEEAGKPAYPIGLTVFPSGETARSRRSISIGGRQANCESFVPACKCFAIYEAIYTCGEDAETLRTFELLLKSVRYHDPKAAFGIVFPAAQDSLRPNTDYTIRWKTRPGLRIRRVNIWVYDTSKPLNFSVLYAKQVPNTGRYDWHTPSVDSAGPYLMEISIVKPLKATPPALASGRIDAGNSNPFYIH